MSSLLINAATVDYKDNININNKKENFSKMNNNNKTLKNNGGTKLKANFLKENFNINNHQNQDNDDDDDDVLENFNNSYTEENTPVQKKNIQEKENSMFDNNVSNENYLPYESDYYKKYIQNLEKIQNTQDNNLNDQLLKKIDNILFLLEDQNEQNFNYITEELILYIFLGIFIIYVLDSFVKIGGKYTR